jgi:hypothetical protein
LLTDGLLVSTGVLSLWQHDRPAAPDLSSSLLQAVQSRCEKGGSVGGRRGIVAVVLAAVILATGCASDEQARNGGEPTTTYTSDGGVEITVEVPRAEDEVTSPLEVSGHAPGSWSFEADFPVEILDADRRTVAEGFATMQGEWMTEDDVDFEGEIEFERPSTETGFLVLRRANPSGLRTNDDAVEIPIRFSP